MVAWVPSERRPVMLTVGPGYDMLSVGVGQPIKPLSDVGRSDARSREYRCPEAVTTSFQVKTNSGEPSRSMFAFSFSANAADNAGRTDLLSENDRRSAGFDKSKESWPEMALVFFSEPSARGAEWLTWAGPRPDWPIIGPSGEAQGVAPSSDPCEKMTLSESSEIGYLNIGDAPFIHDARRDQTSGDQVPQPLSGEEIIFVVVGGGGHGRLLQTSRGANGGGLGSMCFCRGVEGHPQPTFKPASSASRAMVRVSPQRQRQTTRRPRGSLDPITVHAPKFRPGRSVGQFVGDAVGIRSSWLVADFLLPPWPSTPPAPGAFCLVTTPPLRGRAWQADLAAS
jgi:hypothetical protein